MYILPFYNTNLSSLFYQHLRMAPAEVKALSMGPHTLSVPVELFALNRSRLVTSLKDKAEDSVVLLQGGDEVPFYDTDITYNTFR